MKKILNPINLPWITLAAGGIGLLLRIWLFSSGTDDGGLLSPGHPASLLLWLLTFAVVALLIWGTQRLKAGKKYSFNFPASLQRAIGCLLGALSIGVTSVIELILYPDIMTLVASLLGLICVAALVSMANCRWKGHKPNMLFHAAICLYLMIRLVSQYRHWSADPQLMDYCFQLLATVCLMLSAYHKAAFDSGSGDRRLYALFHLGAVYFCCLSLVGSQHIVFYLGTGIWMFWDLCSLKPMREDV